jgi:hypothetical protein
MPDEEMLDSHEFAAALGRPYSTVASWLTAGKVPGAVLEETPRGPVWKIPRSILKSFIPPKQGRPLSKKNKK